MLATFPSRRCAATTRAASSARWTPDRRSPPCRKLHAPPSSQRSVCLGCGPPSKGFTDNRTKAHVLADIRAAVGLGPLAVPMGTPMPTEGGEQPSHAEQPGHVKPPSLPTPQPLIASAPLPIMSTLIASPPLPITSTPQLYPCPLGTCPPGQCACEIDWGTPPHLSSMVTRLPPTMAIDQAPSQPHLPPASAAPVGPGPTPCLQPNFGLTEFEARGGAEITGSQTVADLHGELATCYIVRLADGTTLRATCPEAGPVPSTTAPPPGSIYLGCDSAGTRAWATMDGRVIATSAKSLAAAAPAPPPPLLPPTPSSWRNRYTVYVRRRRAEV